MNDRDPEFATKAVAIIELLLSPPSDGPLFCVDEKLGIGVRRPTAPDQAPVLRRPPARARPARREFEYKRNGTVDLPAGFRVNDGQVCGWVRLREGIDSQAKGGLALLEEGTLRWVAKEMHPAVSQRLARVATQALLVLREG